jgi:hypothetical protein
MMFIIIVHMEIIVEFHFRIVKKALTFKYKIQKHSVDSV